MRPKLSQLLGALTMATAVLLAGNANSQAVAAQALPSSLLITPAEMTPKEAKYYATITDPQLAKEFIVTRSYVRLCQKVEDKTMRAEQLPDKPLGFSARYVLSSEVTLINTAIADSIVAEAGGTVSASHDLPPSQLITSAEMTAKETKFYESLTDPGAAKSFIVTRSYVRLCQKVIDKTLPAGQLPDKPLGFDGRYLLAGEAKLIDTAVSESIVSELRAVKPH